MTYYGGKELAFSFRQVRGNTLLIAEEAPDDKYGFRAAPDCRTIGETLVHIALAPRFQLHIQGNSVNDLKDVNFMELMQSVGAEEKQPRSKSDIVELLKSEGEKFASYLEGLSDAFLAEPVAMPPGSDPSAKSRLEMLLSPKEHEMHHRGQLMVLQRLIGHTPHLTRRMQEWMAKNAPAAPAAQ